MKPETELKTYTSKFCRAAGNHAAALECYTRPQASKSGRSTVARAKVYPGQLKVKGRPCKDSNEQKVGDHGQTAILRTKDNAL